MRSRSLTALPVVLVVTALGLAACAGEAAPEAGTTPAASTSSEPDQEPSDTPSAEPLETASDTCDGDVSDLRVSVRRSRPDLVYAASVSLAPDAALSEDAYSLSLILRDSPGVSVRDPDGLEAPDRLVAAITSGLPERRGFRGATDVPPAGEHLMPVELVNRSGQDVTYVIYAGAIIHRGTWTGMLCVEGDPVPSSGRFTLLSGLQEGVRGCGLVPSSPSPLDPIAQQAACGV